MVIDFITTPIWKALKAEISRATGEEQDIRETSVADANYDSSGKTIDFYNVFGDEIASIDATAFIKDGMVDNVSLSGNILTITFNTDAGKESINIDLTEFIDPTNYYNKFEVNGIISGVNAHIEDIEEVTSRALNELHSGVTESFDKIEELSDVFESGLTSINSGIELDEKVVATAFRDINNRIENNSFVESDNFKDIVKISQTDYDALTAKNPRTLYMIYE